MAVVNTFPGAHPLLQQILVNYRRDLPIHLEALGMKTGSPHSIIETPVRRTLQLPTDVFFFTPRNREHINGLRTPLEIASIHTVFNESVFAGAIVMVIAGAGYFVLPQVGWLIGLVTLPAIVILPYMIVAQANGRINDRVAQGGEFIIGEIVSCVGGLSKRGRAAEFEVTTTFTFPTPNRIKLLGTDKQIRPEFDGKQLPSPGTPVVVLYFSDIEHYLL